MDFQRNKGLRDRQLWRSCYFIKKVMQRILGTSKSTKWLLDASWAISRLAFEASGEMFGNEFHNGSLATNPEILEIPQIKSILEELSIVGIEFLPDGDIQVTYMPMTRKQWDTGSYDDTGMTYDEYMEEFGQ